MHEKNTIYVMKLSDPTTAALMSPGAPFEVVEQGDIRVFKNAAPNMATVLNRSRAFGAAEFIVSGDTRLTYDGFFARVDALASHMIAERNIQKGQSIAICMKNSPEWMIGFVAVIMAGGVAVLINSRGTGEVMRLAIEDADTVLVLADAKRAALLLKSGLSCSVLLSEDFPIEGDAYITPDSTADETAAMMFTSGTTGRAKAAALSNRALIHGMMNTQLAMAVILQKMAENFGTDVQTLRSQLPQSSTLLAFPLFHTSGCTSTFLTTISTGGKLVLMQKWSGKNALELIEKERVSTFGGVPAMYWDMFGVREYDDYDLSSLRALSCGGAALPINVLEEIQRRFPNAFIGAGYGMTEMSGAISQATGEAFTNNPEASGLILPMTDVKIVDNDGNDLPVGEVGEIWAKGATMMSGYHGRPTETAAAHHEGWYKTGDIGRVDDEGYIYIVDRKTDMVISGGENIYCAEVEQALCRHPAVEAITTFGIPDERMGERLVAVVFLNDVSTGTDDLETFAKTQLAAYKVPTEFVIRPNHFELNAMGKVDKRKVRAEYLGEDA